LIRFAPAILLFLVAVGLAAAGLRGVRGRAFWLPSADDGPPELSTYGFVIAQRYARPVGVTVLLVAVLLAAVAIRALLRA
jgi:hypothetical protein